MLTGIGKQIIYTKSAGASALTIIDRKKAEDGVNNLVLRAWRLLRSKWQENPRLVLKLAIDNCSHLLAIVLIFMIPMNKRTISIQIQDRMS